MESDLLTTGEVAKLCGVTSDAVLKWIKKGKLPAARTAGGHYRVARQALETHGYLGADVTNQPCVAAPAQSVQIPKHCWEFFRRDLAPTDACQECVVYRARIEKCYEVVGLGESIGHNRRFCRTSCENCSFFRACKGLALTVLVVTNDEELIGDLKAQADSNEVALRFARCGYDSSTLIETFHPSVVVIDSALPEMKDGRLVESMLQDERILGAKVVIAVRKGDEMMAVPGASVMTAPFTIKKIEQLVQSLELRAGATENIAS